MTTLTFRDSPELNFRETGPDFRWIDCRRFIVDAAGDDRAILAALVADPWYDFSYAEPTPSEPGAREGIHGPYRIEAISAETFIEVDRVTVLTQLDEWVHRYGPLPDPFIAKYRTLVRELLPSGHRLFELPDIRSTA